VGSEIKSGHVRLWVQGSSLVRSDCGFRVQVWSGLTVGSGFKSGQVRLWVQGSSLVRSDCGFRVQVWSDQTVGSGFKSGQVKPKTITLLFAVSPLSTQH
jgi:hypothetical protein